MSETEGNIIEWIFTLIALGVMKIINAISLARTPRKTDSIEEYKE